MSNWHTTTIGQLVHDGVIDPPTDGNHGEIHPKGSDFVESGIPFVMASDIENGVVSLTSCKFIRESQARTLRKGFAIEGDVLLTHKATIGRTAVVPKLDTPYIMLTPQVTYYRVKNKDELDNRFLKYYFDYKPFQETLALWSGAGSTRAYLGITGQHNLTVRLPKIDAQSKIAAALSALDAKIDCNNRINTELEAMAKTLYDYWFVQFDFPFDFAQGKPDANGKPYKSSGGKMVYNPTLKRKIPAGWLHSTIGETFKTHLGGTPSREKEEYWTPSEVNWLSSGENPSTFVVDPDERISNLGLQNSPAKLLPRGTVILSIVRHLRASILGIEAATNQSVVGIVESGAFKHCFIYPYLVREIPRLMVLRTGAQQPHINKGVLDESLLVVPDESTLDAYTSLAAPLFLQIKNYHQQNRELTQLRDWLLPILMNGQVTVA